MNESTTDSIRSADQEIQRILPDGDNAMTIAFTKQFKKGIKEYLNGNWRIAQQNLRNCLTMEPEDGPAKCIYEYMENYDFVAENANWNGFRFFGD